MRLLGFRYGILAAMVVAALAPVAVGGQPSNTSFTDQGPLTQMGSSDTDACDLALSLWDGDDALDLGTQIGSRIPLTASCTRPINAGQSLVPIAAIQEQQSIIEQLTQENAKRESELSELRGRLKRLERMLTTDTEDIR